MSSDNYILINRDTFEVYHKFSSSRGKGEKIGKGGNLVEAVDIAQNYIREELEGNLEYGIVFAEEKKK